MKQKFLALLCITTILLSGCSNHKPSDSKDSNEPSSQQEEDISDSIPDPDDTKEEEPVLPVQISYEYTEKTYQSDDAIDLLSSSYSDPSITVTGNDTATKTIQQKLHSYKKDYEDALQEHLSSATDIQKSNPATFGSFSFQQSYSTQRMDDAVIALQGYTCNYAGGSHENYEYYGLNFDTRSGKFLSLSDITTDQDAFLASVTTYIKSQLKLPYYATGLYVQEDQLDSILSDYVLTDGNWYFTNSGVTFVSNVYVMSTYSNGAYFFTVPYQQLDGLKPDYQYLGAFELSALVGSTVSADLDGDESIDAIYYDTSCQNGSSDVSSTLTINGTDYSDLLSNEECSLSEGASGNNGLEYYLIDLDTSDKYIDIAILDRGLNDDYSTYFFRYVDYNLMYMGCVPDLLSNDSFQIYQDGTMSANMPISLLETAYVTASYEIRKNKIEPGETDWFYLNTANMTAESMKHDILTDVTVYTTNNRRSDAITLTVSAGPVSFLATDNEHWVMLQTADESVYYMYLEDFSTLESGQNVQDVFEGLLLAN